ncbi:MAG: glycerate kinase [Herbiconiux sp.]|nr:MAG: glycerate kinase [Herbiconiux sp.]
MPSPRIVFAPDSFKGTASAAEMAAALADGWARVRAGDRLVLRPMADGGEGTIDAFAAAHPDTCHRVSTVQGPDGGTTHCAWLLLPGSIALVELASASGITLLDELLPLTSHTVGFGEAIVAALDAGAGRLILAIGGSASSDGGAGVLTALGARLLDDNGNPVQPGNAGLAEIESIDLTALRPVPHGGAVVLSDVRNPLLGPHGAVAVFGAQKGITESLVETAELNLVRFAVKLAEAGERHGIDASRFDPTHPGAGAAGGTGFGLRAWGAEIIDGAAEVAARIRLADAVAGADLVITGEGRYDTQSEHGKVPGLVRAVARAAGARCALVAGVVQAGTERFDAASSLAELAGSPSAARAEPVRWAREAGAALAHRFDGRHFHDRREKT